MFLDIAPKHFYSRQIIQPVKQKKQSAQNKKKKEAFLKWKQMTFQFYPPLSFASGVIVGTTVAKKTGWLSIFHTASQLPATHDAPHFVFSSYCGCSTVRYFHHWG